MGKTVTKKKFWILDFFVLKSEVAIESLLRQIQRTKKILLEVKTITKSPGNVIAELSNLAIYIKKSEFSDFKG